MARPDRDRTTGVKGTPRVLTSISLVVALHFAFSYAPFMQAVFETMPVPVPLGLAIAAVGTVLLVILEIEKWVRRRLESSQSV